MFDKHIFEGKTLDDAIDLGLKSLNKKRDEVEIQILDEGKNLLSLNIKPYRISISIKENGENQQNSTDLSDFSSLNEAADTTKFSNGYFTIKFESEGVKLSVFAATSGSYKVEYSDVLKKLDKKGVQDVDQEKVRNCVKEARGEEVIIAPSQEEKKVNSELIIDIAPDRMSASAILTPPDGGKELNIDDAMKILEDNKIKYGVIRDEIISVLSNKLYNRTVCIARGTEPQNGLDGRIEYLFDTSKNNTPRMLEDGTVDFRELDKINNVVKGQELAIIISPTKGCVGYRVTGEEVESRDGKNPAIPKGRNVSISPDGTRLISEAYGQVNIFEGKVSVHELYEVPANVDSSTGNIRFLGKVIIKGNVTTGFSVEAQGDIEIHGVVEGATIVSEGNIVLKRGMQGINKGILKSGQDIIAKYIENATVYCEGNLSTEAIMHSRISVGGKIEVKGKKGLIVGGSIRSGQEILAKTIGSPMATLTEIEVGVNPSLREKYDKIKSEVAYLSENIQKSNQAIELLSRMNKSSSLTEDKLALLNKSIVTKEVLSEKLKVLTAELQSLETSLEMLSVGKVKVSETVYPGTKITIGNSVMYVRDIINYATIYKTDVDIKVGTFQ